MTLITLDSPLYIPSYAGVSISAPSFNTQIIDADLEGIGLVLKAPFSTTITKIGFLLSAHTTNGNIAAAIETVSSGLPSGTLKTTGSSGTTSITAAGYYEVTLGTPATVSRGDLIAITVYRPNGSSLNTTAAFFADGGSRGNPYTVNRSPTWSYNGNGSIFTLYDTSGTPIFIPGNLPISSIVPHNFTSSVMRGNKFVPIATIEANYVMVWADFDNNATIRVYDSDGATILASGTNGSNEPPTNQPTLNFILLDSAVTFYAGNSYYIVCVGASGNNQIYQFTFTSTAVQAASEGYGVFTMVSTSTASPSSPSDFTETSSSAMYVGIIAEKIDMGSGGGLAANPIKGFIG